MTHGQVATLAGGVRLWPVRHRAQPSALRRAPGARPRSCVLAVEEAEVLLLDLHVGQVGGDVLRPPRCRSSRGSGKTRPTPMTCSSAFKRSTPSPSTGSARTPCRWGREPAARCPGSWSRRRVLDLLLGQLRRVPAQVNGGVPAAHQCLDVGEVRVEPGESRRARMMRPTLTPGSEGEASSSPAGCRRSRCSIAAASRRSTALPDVGGDQVGVVLRATSRGTCSPPGSR